MSWETLTNSDMFKGVASIVTGGAFVGYVRERRRGRKDQNTFALDFMREQSKRIDELVQEVADLKAESRASLKAIETLQEVNHDLRGELAKAKFQNDLDAHEITRLKTALGEHERKSA